MVKITNLIAKTASIGINRNRYIFVTLGSFPNGNASTNRILSYARGLAELGFDVSILVLAPETNQSLLSNKKRLSYNKIKIRYTCPFLFVKNNLIRKINFIFGIVTGYIYLTRLLFQYYKQITVSLVFVQPIILYFFIKLIKLFKVNVFHERTEFPFLNGKNDFNYKFYINRVIPLFDGIYVISFSLADYFKGLTKNPVHHIPMTVEFDRFNKKPQKKLKYIAYCGSMYTDKDGVPDLIEAFNIVAGELSDLHLYLIGDNSDQIRFKIINDKILESPFRNRIICTGYIERDEIPQLLIDARILALSRPDNLQAKGGFPTKLGEYLATSNPVIITDVGEHTKYLKDGESAYIAEPNDPQSFANKILECVHDEKRAIQIGKNGYQVALKHFNYLNQAKSLSSFFDSII